MVRHQRPWKVVQEIPCQALHDGHMLQRGKAYTNSNPLTSGSPATLKTIAIPVPKHWSETWLVTWWQPTKQRNSFDVPSLEAVRIILPRAQQIQCICETIRAQGYGSLAASNSMHIHCISNIYNYHFFVGARFPCCIARWLDSPAYGIYSSTNVLHI